MYGNSLYLRGEIEPRNALVGLLLPAMRPLVGWTVQRDLDALAEAATPQGTQSQEDGRRRQQWSGSCQNPEHGLTRPEPGGANEAEIHVPDLQGCRGARMGWIRERAYAGATADGPGSPYPLLRLWPRREPQSPLSRLVIHLVGVDVVTPRAATIDSPLTTLNLYVLRVPFMSDEEGTYGGFLVAFFYQAVATHDGCLSFAPTSWKR